MCENIVSRRPALTHRGARSATTGRSANVRPCRLFRALSAAASSTKLKHRPDVLRVERRAEGVRAHNAHLPHLPERLALQRRLFSISSASAGSISSSRVVKPRNTAAKTRDVRRFHPSSSFARSSFCHLSSSRAATSSSPRAASPPGTPSAGGPRRRLEGDARPPRIGASPRRAPASPERAVGAPGARRAAALIRGRRVRLTLNAAFTDEIPPRFKNVFFARLAASRVVSRLPRRTQWVLAFARASRGTKTLQRFARRRARPQPPRFCARPLRRPRRRRRRGDPWAPGYLWTTFAVRSRPSRARYRHQTVIQRDAVFRRVVPLPHATSFFLRFFFASGPASRAPRASRRLREASSRASPSPSRRGVSRAFASEGNRRAREVSISSARRAFCGDGALRRRRPERVRGDYLQVAPRARRG